MSIATLERPETIPVVDQTSGVGLNYPLRGKGIEVGIHEIDNPGPNDGMIELDKQSMEKRWGSFVQGSIIQPHFLGENLQTKNIVRGSIPFPVGTKDLLPDIMTRARERFIERSQMKKITSFNSEDSLLTVRETTGKTEIDDETLSFFEDLDDAAAEVIRRRHPFQDHPSVREFFAYHEIRSMPENRRRFRERVRTALMDPNSPNENAFTSDPNAPFFMKMTVIKDGRTIAKNVADEDVDFNGCQTVPGLGHDVLLDHVADKNKNASQNVEIEIIGDGSSDVGGCGDDPERSCSAFFKAKMKQIEKLLKNSGQSISKIKSEFLTRMSLVFKYDDPNFAFLSTGETSKCKNCGEYKDGDCECGDTEKKDNKKSN